MSITSIENLSNEIFYEIFDYLDGYYLYKAFSNLNHHFQEFLNSPILSFKIHFHSQDNETSTDEFKQFILHYKHKIKSFNFYLSTKYKQFYSSFNIDSSFDRLESLTLIKLDFTLHNLLISNLTSLPRLFSLTIDVLQESCKDLSDVYRFIFVLPKLKYTKCSVEEYGICTPTSLPIAMDKQFGSIEHLIIDHSCTSKDLFAILSYTPQLCYLKFQHTDESDSTISTISSITLSNLTSISMDTYYMTFDQLERLISKLDCQLKVFRVITISPDSDYFNADRWEGLISEYLPQLEEFYFQYSKEYDPKYNTPTYSKDPNPFLSSFWIEQEWLLDVKMDSCEAIYSICPYKERWYDAVDSTKLSKSTRLTITDLPQSEDIEFLTMIIDDILTMTYIYQLEISHKKIDIGTLTDIFHALPKLRSLKLHSLLLSEPKELFCDEKIIYLAAKNHKIRKVCLEKMIEMREVYYLMALCPRMNYLQVDCIDSIEIEIFIRDILSQIKKNSNKYLRLLCIRIPKVNDKMIKKLKEMIHSKKLLDHYTIECEVDRIYLQWEDD